MGKISLDDIDLQILNLLKANSKIGTKEIAAKIGLTNTPTFERIKRLERIGVIKQYTVVLDKQKLGFELGVICWVSLKDHTHESLQIFEKQIQELKEVKNCYYLSGDFDYTLYVEIENMENYHQFLTKKLAAIPNIAKVQSAFIMNTIKEV